MSEALDLTNKKISDDPDVIEASWDDRPNGRNSAAYTHQVKLESIEKPDEIIDSPDEDEERR